MKKIPFYPILFCLFPILSIWGSNIKFVADWMPWRFILASLLGTAIWLVFFQFISKSVTKSALLVSILNLAFFSYGHVYTLMEDAHLFGWNFGRHRYLIVLLVVLTLFAICKVIRSQRSFLDWVIPLTVMGSALWVFPIFQIISYRIQELQKPEKIQTQMRPSNSQEEIRIPPGKIPQELPDVYYIILDSYARQDILKECFHYDNSSFIHSLEGIGFTVAGESRANLTITDLSLAASMNMDYPQDMAENSAKASDPGVLSTWIKSSRIREVFKEAGYTFVAFDSGYSMTRIKDADVYMSLDESRQLLTGGINSLEGMVIKSSAGILLYEFYGSLPEPLRVFLDSAYLHHRNLILFQLDELPTIAQDPRPTFTFVHILAPHNPFVFGPNGENIVRLTPFTLDDDPETKDPEKYKQEYGDQVTYLNQRILAIFQAIIDQSVVDPVIIVEGDHGPPRWVTSVTGRSDILNAYYFPGSEKSVYPTITPVNTFRIVLNDVFGTRLKLLPDRTFYTTHSTIDQLIPVDKDKKHCDPDYLPDSNGSQISGEVK